MSSLKDSLGEEWYEILKDEFSKDYMKKLSYFIASRRDIGIVYPPADDVFNAYKYTPYSNVRVCIIGQDPYINAFEAHGLAFSTWNAQYTPSLRQIEKTVRSDVYPDDEEYKWYNNLTDWTKQGIMLLNSVLTVDAGKSASHRGLGWESFVTRTIVELDKKGIIFLLWGKDSQAFLRYITNSKVFTCEHPVAASYQGRTWDNRNCFNEVNELLTNKIIW